MRPQPRAAVAGGGRATLHTDGAVIWAPVLDAAELERRRQAWGGR